MYNLYLQKLKFISTPSPKWTPNDILCEELYQDGDSSFMDVLTFNITGRDRRVDVPKATELDQSTNKIIHQTEC